VLYSHNKIKKTFQRHS